MTYDGRPRIVPMRVATDFSVEERDPDPRGKPVYGLDDKIGATVTDIWVDRAEPQIRYLEIATDGGGQALLPINFVRISKDGERVQVVAIRSDHFAMVPGLANPDQVTLQEEDKICAFYGGGHLYATPQRAEPILRTNTNQNRSAAFPNTSRKVSASSGRANRNGASSRCGCFTCARSLSTSRSWPLRTSR